MQRLTVTVTEAAEILGVSRTSAYELVRAGTLPSVRLGRRIVVTRHALEELLGAPLPAQRAPGAVSPVANAQPPGVLGSPR
jgi:excisionase family DNA binding protein